MTPVRFAESVRSSSTDLSLRELLEQPVTELLGVGQDSATALESIDVHTIFDLGSSATFAQESAALIAASSGSKGVATEDEALAEMRATLVARAQVILLER